MIIMYPIPQILDTLSMEVKLWLVGNAENVDIHWKLTHHRSSAHPVKRNVNFSIPPVTHLIVHPLVSTNV